ncbi:MAG: hypothetical protein Q4D48_05630, partial [Coriobacteriales bacterium]|nr:hypothetical protein [Coriobacteriales bacterium]
MRRTTHMKNEPSGKSTQATMGQRALCMLLSATLAFSSMPSATLRALAEEQDEPELTVSEADLNEDTELEQGSSEVEPGEGTSTELEDPTTEPTGEDIDPDSEGTTIPDQPTSDEPAPTEDDQQQGADEVDPAQETETPAKAPSEQPVEEVTAEAETITVSEKARNNQLRNSSGAYVPYATKEEGPVVTSIWLKDAEDSYILKPGSDGTNLDLKDVTEDVCKNAVLLEVTLEAIDLSSAADINVSKSKVLLVNEMGDIVKQSLFLKKTDDNDNIVPDTYVAKLGTTEEAQWLVEGKLGIVVIAEDGSGHALHMEDESKLFVLYNAFEDSEDGDKIKADGSFILDRTAPTGTAAMRGGGASQTLVEESVGTVIHDDSAVLELDVTEDNLDPDASRVTIQQGDTSWQLSGADFWGDLSSVEESLDEGTYSTISWQLVDKAGNSSATMNYYQVVVDEGMPKVSVTYDQPEIPVSGNRYFSTSPVTVIIEVTDGNLNFESDHTFVTITGTAASGATLPEYDKDAWQTSGRVHTYELTLTDGSYQIAVSAHDTAGYTVTTNPTFCIDAQAPIVEVSIQDELTPFPITENGKTFDYYNQFPTFDIEVSDLNLDDAKTTIFGATLADILADTASIEHVTFADVSDTTDPNTGLRTVLATVTFGDGFYDLPLVHAEDVLGNVTEETHTADVMVVDTTAPQMTAVAIGEAPADLGKDAAGADIENGRETGLDELRNSIFFFKTDKTALQLRVTEPNGIDFISLEDASGRYSLGDTVLDAISAGNATLGTAAHTGIYDLTIIDELQDGIDLSDGVVVSITDYAQNTQTWRISESLPSILAPDFGGTSIGGAPTLIVLDVTPPEITLEGPVDRTDAVASAYKRFYNTNQTSTLTVNERSLKYLRGFEGGAEGDTHGDVNGTYDALDPNRSVLTVTYTAPTSGATSTTSCVTVSDLTTKNDGLNYTWTHTYEDDGDYEIAAQVKDVVGLSSEALTIEKFTIDRTAPLIEVKWVPAEDESVNYGYFSSARTVTITVTEHNFDPVLFKITTSAVNTPNTYTNFVYQPGDWVDDGDEHRYTVNFTDDGTYSILVEGVDEAGNVALYQGPNGPDTSYASDEFTIDTEAPAIAKYYQNGGAPASTFDYDDPVVELPKPTGTYAGKNYYAHTINVDAKVQDRNVDTIDLTLSVTKDGTEKTLTPTWEPATEDRGDNGRELYVTTIPYVEDGEFLAPHVTAKDLALNASDNAEDAKANGFVIDLKAPTITVAVDHEPSAQGTSGSSDPYNFYNQATKMTFTVSDEHLLRSVQLDDPSGQYSISTSESSAEGKGQVVLTASLKDGTAAQDAEYQRDIVLTAVDLAGNIRTWTIDHTGKVVLDEVSSTAENTGINDGTEHPQALIQDTVAPVVGLSGVTEGNYYNTAQTVEATVEELNFDYLQTFDGGRGIVTVTSYEGNAGRAMSTSTVAANDFSGSKPNYSYSQSFSSDGHYELT